MAYSKPVSHRTVQELAREPMLLIPQRYIQVNEKPNILSDNTSFSTIPVVDMKHLIMGEAMDFELDRFHSICKEWGVFQLVNHGVCSSLVEKLKYECEEFFKLPLEEKMRYNARPGELEGYTPTIFQSEVEQADWSDRLHFITNPIHKRKSHLLPQLPSPLRETLEAYLLELQKLATTLLGLITQALKLDKREMEGMFEDGLQSFRMGYYPPCPQPEIVVGLRSHSDASGITFLLQVNGVDGLQVKKDGVWIPVKFLPDFFVVNLGDVLEILSNGIYNSIEHRVTVNSTKERISTSMFFNPNFQAEVGPAISLITPENPPLFKRVGMEKYFKDALASRFIGKSYLESMKINKEENVDDAAT